jgi:transposase
MAGKPKHMSQIKQLIQLHQQGKGIKFIARSLGISKNTVRSYLAKMALSPLSFESMLALDNPILEGKFHAGNPAYKDERFEYLKANLEYYSKELKSVGVTKKTLWEEYRDANPPGYGYSQFCFHLTQQLIARRPSMVLSHIAGEKLFIDFAGKKLSYIDILTGEEVQCQVFVACLPYSDYSFVMAVKSQSVSDFLYALGCCLEALGGVPQVLVPDNLKSAIIKASPYEPEVNVALDDFANHYHTTVIPARARKPKDKALVENQVKMIYNRVYAKLRNLQFFDLASLNQAIKEKTRDHNQTRMQINPYCREEKFLSDEKHLLQPLPDQLFELKYYRELKVQKNNHIYLAQDKHYYSVPFAHIGSKVKVIYTRTMVRIYAKGEQIALHIRDFRIGIYSTIKEHLCSHHQHYLDCSPDYYIDNAKSKSETLHLLFKLLFTQKRHPEQLYKSCQGILSLQRKSDPNEFQRACLMAIELQNYTYTFIKNILKNKMTAESLSTQQTQPLPSHRNIRGKEYYTQSSINFKHLTLSDYDAN